MTTRRRHGAWMRLFAWTALVFLAWAAPALADDCLRDPLNANDCLRTPGTAQVIAGVTSVVVSVLVNGQEIVRTVLQPQDTSPPDGEGDQPEPRHLQLQIVTQGASGDLASALNLSEGGLIYIQAWCEEAGKGALPAATATIRFRLTEGQGWVTLAPAASSHGTKVALVQPAEPQPPGMPPEAAGVYASATFEGQTVGASVQIQLIQSQYRLRLY